MIRSTKFCIVTVCLNSEKTIKDTIESVLTQDFKDWILIIKDGGSSDSTISIVKSYIERFGDSIILIVEKDNGIYQAMNQAIELITNPETFVIFLNSDDYFDSKYVLSEISSGCNDSDFIYGKIRIIGEKNKEIIYGREIYEKDFITDNYAHQSVFVKRKIFNITNGFNEGLKIASDYEFYLKVFKIRDIKILYLPIIVSTMRNTGISNTRIYLSQFERLKCIYKHRGVLIGLKATLVLTYSLLVKLANE